MGGGDFGEVRHLCTGRLSNFEKQQCYFTTGDYILKTKYSVYPYRIFTL